MGGVGDVLVAVLLYFHLFDRVRPRVEVDLATLGVERKVRHFDETTRVQTYLRHPGDHARVRYPRVEVFHFV